MTIVLCTVLYLHLFVTSKGLINVILMIYMTREFKRLDKYALPQSSLARTHHPSSSMEKSGGTGLLHMSKAADLQDEHPLRHSVVHINLVDLPTIPGNTYIAPSSWKTSSGGMEYMRDMTFNSPHDV